ncbi:MAG: DNA polymerase III subunit chi [Caulobacteraceae bacterium]|nr:DNA polymerase III subunit chi [Caulobacteraceae bacterium]
MKSTWTRAAATLSLGSQRGWRAVGDRSWSPERVEQLDTAIWSFREDSFVPHARDGDPAKQPVWLTVEGGNPNGAQALFLVDDAEPGDLASFERAPDGSS